MNCNSKLSFAVMTVATLIVVAIVMLKAGSAQAAATQSNKVVKTTVNVRRAIEIADTTLSPGKYRVKITPASDSSSDPTVQFLIVYNPYGDENNPPYEEEVVLTVQASTKDLDAPAARTELILTPVDSTKATSLEIRGNSTEYVFGAMVTSAAKNH